MDKYVVLDIETTGTSILDSDIIEIGAVYIENNQVTKIFNQLVYTPQVITPYIQGITGINNMMLEGKPHIEEVLIKFIEFCGDAPIVGHNVILFDYRMIKAKAKKYKIDFQKDAVDTLVIARKYLKNLPSRKLGDLCTYYNINLVNAHRAYDDAHATYMLYCNLKKDFGVIGEVDFMPKCIEWEVPKNPPITEKQKKYILNLCDLHKIELTKPVDEYSKSNASKMIDQIIREYGKQ
ncbi:MAG: 3'-5' exonuclease [Cellulosilyticaceae bacterium]